MPEQNNQLLNIKLPNITLLDKRYELTIDFSTSPDLLINIAVKKKIDEVKQLPSGTNPIQIGDGELEK